MEPEAFSSAASSVIDLLSPDCRGHVLGFLTLAECLRVSETSTTNLGYSVREVGRRRRDQFLLRPWEEAETSPFCTTHWTRKTARRMSNWQPRRQGTSRGTLLDDQAFLHKARPTASGASLDDEHPHEWYELPSVLERLQWLYTGISKTHPLRTELRNLVRDLEEPPKFGDEDDEEPATNKRRRRLVQQLSAVTKAHRLHASLLSRCTLNLRPDAYNPHGDDDDDDNDLDEEETTSKRPTNGHRESSSYTSPSSPPSQSRSFTVTLERYMGDVLVARCLTGHSHYFGKDRPTNYMNQDTAPGSSSLDASCSLHHYDRKSEAVVEGGPCLDAWIDHLISFSANPSSSSSSSPGSNHHDDDLPSEEPPVPPVEVWYQYWVFFHSSLLQISPFSVSQARKLDLYPFSGILNPLDIYQHDDEHETDDDDPPWFLPSRTYIYFLPRCKVLKAIAEGLYRTFVHVPQHQHQNPPTSHPEPHRIGILETTLNHLGGPRAWRQNRDEWVATTAVMSPHQLYVSLLRNSVLRRYGGGMEHGGGGHPRRPRRDTADLRRWLRNADTLGVVRWMQLLQDQWKRTRNHHHDDAEPPLVTVRMVPVGGGTYLPAGGLAP